MNDFFERHQNTILWTLLLMVLLGMMFAASLKSQATWIVPATALLLGLVSVRLPRPWSLGAIGMLLWGLGEASWVLEGQKQVLLPIADTLYILGYFVWYYMFSKVSNTRPPRLVLFLTVPMLGLAVWVLFATPINSIAKLYPVLDCLLLLAAAPAAQAFLEGKAPLSRAVWLIAFHGFVLIDTLYGLQRNNASWSMTSIDNLAYALLYLTTGLGLLLEATSRKTDVKPLVLAVFLIVALRFLVRLDDAQTLLMQVISWMFFYVTFAALTGMVVSFMNHQRLSHLRYRHHLSTLKAVLVPYQQQLASGQPSRTELETALIALQQHLPGLYGARILGGLEFHWGVMGGHPVKQNFTLPESGEVTVQLHLADPNDTEQAEAALDAMEHLLYLADHQRVFTRQVNTDPLTHLLNRRSAEQELDRIFQQSTMENTPITVAMLDLDRFKRINDTYGHATGDQVLVGFARFLQGQLRSHDLIFRWGGEEFLLVFPQLCPVGVGEVLERLRASLKERGPLHDDLHVTFSAGVYGGIPEGSGCATKWIEKADHHLLQAKDSGRNRTVGEVQPPDRKN
ncbi:GGDEF domain-containing protein [Deinococcus cellulosilyticus]|uniref:GGDEF domain-containing protein n=1 Tax=Deinococcus cellulosilyticus (strain DSM 18568 / NBRC 106333 / KACC 11606 / 5516J-15) TaxID=1223518 RepID=A0A511N1C0_DEIC1|nr:GGDEF domain-containing protein [Deinococcus cellulosilyticus]GEM46241.1 hypothetical protein DC3_18760 [Deinococcus cellulosilyticus NBRC 106333 = KACC 11606]